MKRCAALFTGLLIIAILIPTLAGCGSVASLETLARPTPKEEYQAFLGTKIKSDEAFNMKTLSSALIVKALFYGQDVDARARLLFQGDPIFSRETSDWKFSPKGTNDTQGANGAQNFYGPPIAILMGLFTPDLDEKDVTKLGRFRPKLKTPDGRLLSPAAIKRFGRDSAFVRDYFPVFTPWEEVFLIQFNPLTDSRYSGGPPLEFILEWPGGVQNLTLQVN